MLPQWGEKQAVINEMKFRERQQQINNGIHIDKHQKMLIISFGG